MDVGCYLNRIEVDSIQGLSWKSHTYLAKKSQFLPVRLLQMAQISKGNMLIYNREDDGREVNCRGTPHKAFLLALAAIKDSEIKYLNPTGKPITDEELALIDAVAPTVTVTDLRLWGELRHLSPAALHRLMFGFSSVKELSLLRFNGNQLTDEHLRDDEALLDFLYAPDHGMHKREAVLTAFNASPQFVQKLVNRANLATDIGRVELVVQQLPLGSQKLGGLRLTVHRGIAEYFEQLENGARVTLEFGREEVPPRRARMTDEEEESKDKSRYTFWK